MSNIFSKLFSNNNENEVSEKQLESQLSIRDIEEAEKILARIKQKKAEHQSNKSSEQRRVDNSDSIINNRYIGVECTINSLPEIITANYHRFDLNNIKQELQNTPKEKHLVLSFQDDGSHKIDYEDYSAKFASPDSIHIHEHNGKLSFDMINGGNVKFPQGTIIGIDYNGTMHAYPQGFPNEKELTHTYNNQEQKLVKDRNYGCNIEKLPILNLAGREIIALQKYKELISGLSSGERLDIGRAPQTEKAIKTSDNPYISECHVSIQKISETIFITDQSKNGTCIFEEINNNDATATKKRIQNKAEREDEHYNAHMFSIFKNHTLD